MKAKKRLSTVEVAFMGLLFAFALVFSFIESQFAAFIPIPGIKPGLSNIITMYCLFFLGRRQAFTIAVLKSAFVFLTRGWIASMMSLSGGLVSVGIMILLMLPKKLDLSYTMISVAGGLAHNFGQLMMASLLLKSSLTMYYLPVLAVSGVIMGIVTGVILKLMAPYMRTLQSKHIRGK